MNDADSRIVRNATYLFAGSVVADVAAFLFQLIVARGFGPEGFGLFSLALMTITMGASISLVGLPDGIVTFVSRYRSQQKPNRIAGVLVSSVVIAVIASIATAVAVWFLAPLISIEFFDAPELVPLLRTLVLGLPARVLIALTAAVCLGYERGGLQSSVKRIFPKLGTFGAAAVVVLVNGSLQEVVAAYVVALWCGAVFGSLIAAIVIRETPADGLTFQTRELFGFSVPLLFTGFVAFFLNWTDAALIGYFLESDDVGVYQAAFVLGTNVAMFSSVIGSALYPNFGSLVAERKVETLQTRFVEGVQWIAIFTLAPCIYLIAFPGLSIGMLFGPDFAGGTRPLVILVTGQVFASMLALSTNVLKATKNSRYIFFTYFGALVINVVINVTLIPLFGIIGAAIGTITARTLANGLHYGWVRSQFEVHLPVAPIGRVLGGGIIAVALVWPLQRFVTSIPSFLTHIGVFSSLYGFCMIGLGVVSISDVRRFIVENFPSLG